MSAPQFVDHRADHRRVTSQGNIPSHSHVKLPPKNKSAGNLLRLHGKKGHKRFASAHASSEHVAELRKKDRNSQSTGNIALKDRKGVPKMSARRHATLDQSTSGDEGWEEEAPDSDSAASPPTPDSKPQVSNKTKTNTKESPVDSITIPLGPPVGQWDVGENESQDGQESQSVPPPPLPDTFFPITPSKRTASSTVLSMGFEGPTIHPDKFEEFSRTPRLEKRQVPAPIVHVQPMTRKENIVEQGSFTTTATQLSTTPRNAKLEGQSVVKPLTSTQRSTSTPNKGPPKLVRALSEQTPLATSPVATNISFPSTRPLSPLSETNRVISPQSQNQVLASSATTHDTIVEHASLRSAKSIPAFYRTPSAVSIKRQSVALPPTLSNATAIIDEFNHNEALRTAPVNGKFDFSIANPIHAGSNSVPTIPSSLGPSPDSSSPSSLRQSPRKRQPSTSEDLTQRLKTISSSHSISGSVSGQRSPGTARLSSLNYFPSISRIFSPSSISSKPKVKRATVLEPGAFQSVVAKFTEPDHMLERPFPYRFTTKESRAADLATKKRCYYVDPSLLTEEQSLTVRGDSLYKHGPRPPILPPPLKRRGVADEERKGESEEQRERRRAADWQRWRSWAVMLYREDEAREATLHTMKRYGRDPVAESFKRLTQQKSRDDLTARAEAH